MTPVDEISEKTEDEKFIDELVNDHQKFDDYIYFSSMEEAMIELERRRNDKELQKKVDEYFKDVGIPLHFKNDPRLVLFRQVATPNIEVSRFLIIADGVEMKPLFLEYYDDKFTSNNEWKWHLGKLAFYEGLNKKGDSMISHKLIIDFVESDGEKLGNIKTFWGESLVKFHHRLFDENYRHVDSNTFFDGTEWFKKNELSAKIYYKIVLGLFVSNGILLENFLLSGDEHKFSKNVFLPAFKFIHNHFNLKPIIVALSPTTIENDKFWFCQNPQTKKRIDDIINKYDRNN